MHPYQFGILEKPCANKPNKKSSSNLQGKKYRDLKITVGEASVRPTGLSTINHITLSTIPSHLNLSPARHKGKAAQGRVNLAIKLSASDFAKTLER